MAKVKKAAIVSIETGEIIDALYEGDKIKRKESLDYLEEKKKKEEQTQEWKIENFYMGNIEEIRKWMEDLSTIEKAFLFSVVPYISYDDCHLMYANKKDIGTEDLVKISGLSRAKTYEVIKTLNKKDILYRGKNSNSRQFFINPWLFCKGNRINKVLRTMFNNYKIRVLGNQKWADIE